MAYQERDLIQRKVLDSWVFIAPTEKLSFADYKAKYKMQVQLFLLIFLVDY